MAVAMKIQDQRRINPQRLQYRFERWRPMKALFHRLHGVAKVPMRSEGAVSIERREAIEVRKSRNIDERRVRVTWLDEQEHTQALFCPGRRIRPRIHGMSIIRVLAYP